jgi:hypothetical protein
LREPFPVRRPWVQIDPIETGGASWSAPGSFERHGALRRADSCSRPGDETDRNRLARQAKPESVRAISRKKLKETKRGHGRRLPLARLAPLFSSFFVLFG